MNVSLADIDECAQGASILCNFRCVNVPGSYQCACPEWGYTMTANGRSCKGKQGSLPTRASARVLADIASHSLLCTWSSHTSAYTQNDQCLWWSVSGMRKVTAFLLLDPAYNFLDLDLALRLSLGAGQGSHGVVLKGMRDLSSEKPAEEQLSVSQSLSPSVYDSI